jgi:hypothetical protein
MCTLLYLRTQGELAISPVGDISAFVILCTVLYTKTDTAICGHTNIIWSHSFPRKVQCPSVHSYSTVTSALGCQLYPGPEQTGEEPKMLGGGRSGREVWRKALHERRVAQVLEEASTPTLDHLASHIEGSAYRDKDAKYDPDYCRERDGLQKHAEAGCGEDPLRQRPLNEEIPMRAWWGGRHRQPYMSTCARRKKNDEETYPCPTPPSQKQSGSRLTAVHMKRLRAVGR